MFGRGRFMNYEKLRIAVLNCRSDTTVAQAFRKAFGLPYNHLPKPLEIPKKDFKKSRRRHREYERMMHQTIGAMDRSGKR